MMLSEAGNIYLQVYWKQYGLEGIISVLTTDFFPERKFDIYVQTLSCKIACKEVVFSAFFMQNIRKSKEI